MLGTGPLLGQALQNAWDRPALGTVVVAVVVVVVAVVVDRGGLVGTLGRGGRSLMHGIGKKTSPTKGIEITTFRTSSKMEFSGISTFTSREVFIW